MMGPMVPGRPIVRVNGIGTAGFVVSTVIAGSTDRWTAGSIVIAVLLFAVGVASFLWAFFAAVERSRVDEIGVANVFLLTGSTAVPPVKRAMSALLATQVVTAFVGATIGFAGIGVDELNPLAFGILVPMFGLGMNGVWAARHGRFGPRIVTPSGRPTPAVPPTDIEMEQNPSHG
jgi:hypothetical protein